MWYENDEFEGAGIMSEANSFEGLLQNVEMVHALTSIAAKGAVNQMLTVRNWVIGYYIVEFEQNGQDRSIYGSALLTNLAKKLNIKGLDRQMLTSCRTFYQKYPQMCGTVLRKLKSASTSSNQAAGIQALLPDSSQVVVDTVPAKICGTVSRKFEIDPELLITMLS